MKQNIRDFLEKIFKKSDIRKSIKQKSWRKIGAKYMTRT